MAQCDPPPDGWRATAELAPGAVTDPECPDFLPPSSESSSSGDDWTAGTATLYRTLCEDGIAVRYRSTLTLDRLALVATPWEFDSTQGCCGAGGGGGGGGDGGGSVVPCCPADAVADTLYLVIDGTGTMLDPSACQCVDATVELTREEYFPGAYRWAGGVENWCGVGDYRVHLYPCAGPGSDWEIRIEIGVEVVVVCAAFAIATNSCDPLVLAANGVLLSASNACPCPASGFSTANVVVTE